MKKLSWSCLPTNVRFTGFLIAMIGDVIFLLSVFCMKDSWRAGIPEKDKTELVTNGIYQYSRNPAFLGFDLQYIGVFLLFGNPWTALCSAFAIIMLHLQNGTWCADIENRRRNVGKHPEH